MAAYMFKTILLLPLSTEQIKSLFNANNKEGTDLKKRGPDKTLVTWSFMNASSDVRRLLTVFLYRLWVRNEAATLTLLVDDEDQAVRMASYKELVKIYGEKKKKSLWSRLENEECLVLKETLFSGNLRDRQLWIEHRRFEWGEARAKISVEETEGSSK